MPYVTPGEIRAVLAPDPSQPSGTPGELSDSTLESRIATAEAQVNAALGARYTVPFVDPPPRLVVDITGAIAAYLAALTYRKSVDITATDPLNLRFQWAVGLLAALNAGKADLPIAAGVPTRATGAAVIQPYTGEMFPADSFGLGRDRRGRYRGGGWWS